MLDGEKTVEIAWGKSAGRERDSMLDGEETVQIGCGEFTGREGDSMLHGGKCENSLRRVSLGGSEITCWTDRKPWK